MVVTLFNSKYDDTKILQFKDYAKILEVQRPMTFVMKVCGFSSLSRSGAPKFVSAFSDCIGCRLQAEESASCPTIQHCSGNEMGI